MKISIFGITVDIDLTDYDKKAYERLLKKLANRRVLYEPEDSEWVGEVVNSVKLIRDYVEAALGEVDDSSKIVEPLLSLQGAARRFITKTKMLSEHLKHNVTLIRRKKEVGEPLTLDEEELLKHYDIFGSPDLTENTSLNLSHVRPVGYQIAFANALGRFRGEVSQILGILCSVTLVTLPGPLVALSPRDDDEGDASDVGA